MYIHITQIYTSKSNKLDTLLKVRYHIKRNTIQVLPSIYRLHTYIQMKKTKHSADSHSRLENITSFV